MGVGLTAHGTYNASCVTLKAATIFECPPQWVTGIRIECKHSALIVLSPTPKHCGCRIQRQLMLSAVFFPVQFIVHVNDASLEIDVVVLD